MTRALLLLSLLGAVAGPELPAQAAPIKHGTIAVLPFGTAAPHATAAETARQIGTAMEQQLTESKRFSAVLARQELGNAAIAEIEAAKEPLSLNALVQISKESRLPANYLLHGWLEQYDVRELQTEKGKRVRADARVRVRIVDVETSALVLSSTLDLTNSPVAQAVEQHAPGGRSIMDKVRKWPVPKIPRTGAIDGAISALDDATEQDAVNRLRLSTGPAAQRFIESELGFVLVNYDVAPDGGVTELTFPLAPALKNGTQLILVEMRENRMRGGLIEESLGEAVVSRLSDKYVYARLTKGQAEITRALKERPAGVQVRLKGRQ
jgi:hypothetical protein